MIPQKVLKLKSEETSTVLEEGPKTVQSKRYRLVVIGFGFVALLLLPALDQWLGLSSHFKSTEKRILKPLPTFEFPHLRTFIYQFDQYYKENFGWRNALFYQYSHWKYTIVGASPLPEKVVIGKNGWFYPGNSVNNVVDQHRGLLPISEDTLQSVANRLTRYQQLLAKQGTRLYVMIAPDSYTIYPENLPDHLRSAAHSFNFDQIKRYMATHTTIPLVDVRDALRKAKPKYQVYCQTDSHWNDYGSLIATLTLADRIRQDFPEVPMARLSDYRVRTQKGEGGDLVTMLALNRKCQDSVSYKIVPSPHLVTKQTESIPNAEIGIPSQRFVGSASSLPKLLLIGDSFSYTMNQFIPGYFRESYLVRSNRLNMELVQAEQPDVVVVEIVERNILSLSRL